MGNLFLKLGPQTWKQGADAVKMFRRYGTQTPIVPNSPLMERISTYVPEARERYGLIGNTDITDAEIAGSLYKKAMSLSKKGNAAVNEYGEPLLLFRGDTQRYQSFKPHFSPEEEAKRRGTMDNALGTLFLGNQPISWGGGERYLGTIRDFGGQLTYEPSETGVAFVKDLPSLEQGNLPEGSRLLFSHEVQGFPLKAYKLPGKYITSGVNDLNAFVVNTKAVRDATPEISVLDDDFLLRGGERTNSHAVVRLITRGNEHVYVFPDGSEAPAELGQDLRDYMAKHYNYVLNDAKKQNQGLLKSNKGSLLREEHTDYDYYALPNFNLNGAKSILPYDLNRPTIPIIDRGLLYRKQGGILKRI